MIDNKDKFLQARDIVMEAAATLPRIAFQTLADECIPKLVGHPGGSEHHHGYRNGLIIHTAEVVIMARVIGERLGADQQVVTAAAVMHDYGKIYDYVFVEGPSVEKMIDGTFISNVRGPDLVQRVPKYDIGKHIVKSFEKFHEWRVRHGFVGLSETQLDNIGHCIISHHAEKNWGSPTRPETPEAWAVHLADMASAMSGVVL